MSELSAHIAYHVHIQWLRSALLDSFDALCKLTEAIERIEEMA